MRKNRIREIRKSKRITGPELAEKVGISTQYLYDIEKGKRGLSSEIASKLSEILKVTTDYLIGIADENLYDEDKRKGSDPHSESELAEIPIEKLNQYKLVYKGHRLTDEEAKDLINLLEAALKRWK